MACTAAGAVAAACLWLAPAQVSAKTSAFLVSPAPAPAPVLLRRPSNLPLVKRKTSASPLCIRSASNGGTDEKPPFGYTRKDVLLIGLGVTIVGVGLKYGLEFTGIDPLKAGNAVQIVTILGLVGWTLSYVFRVSVKEMTYAKQLRDYESKVIEKRLEELPEAELESLLAQVEEEKQRLKARRDKQSKPE